MQVLRGYMCRNLRETRQAFIAPSTPILSFSSTPRRRPQRTTLPWNALKVGVSSTLLRQNVNWQSGVRKLRRYALGVYMCHTNGVSANLIILTQEDIRRTRAILQKISGVPNVARSCVLSYQTQADEDIVGYGSLDWFEGMPSCPWFYILDFPGGFGFSLYVPLIFLLVVEQALLLQINADIIFFQQPYTMSDVNKPLFAADLSIASGVARLR